MNPSPIPTYPPTPDLCSECKRNAPSLDRIIPAHGYVPGNIRVICRAMNCAMQEWGEDAVWEMFQNWASLRKLPRRS